MITKTEMHYVQMNKSESVTQSAQILNGEIAGADTYYHTVAAGEALNIEAKPSAYHVLFMTDGKASFSSGADAGTLIEVRSLYAAGMGEAVTIKAEADTYLFEIEMHANDDDVAKAAKYATKFPIVQKYDECEQYWDTSKTQKTINRIILEQENIPRLAMGSVESIGPDYVIPNNHPTVDQLFFTFPENETELIINDEKMDLGGNILLHIPLGADHGSDVADGKHMHYIWCDFLLEEECVEYLKEEHIKTGEQRSF